MHSSISHIYTVDAEVFILTQIIKQMTKEKITHDERKKQRIAKRGRLTLEIVRKYSYFIVGTVLYCQLHYTI